MYVVKYTSIWFGNTGQPSFLTRYGSTDPLEVLVNVIEKMHSFVFNIINNHQIDHHMVLNEGFCYIMPLEPEYAVLCGLPLEEEIFTLCIIENSFNILFK